MSRKLFTEEEINILNSNIYTKKCTQYTIKFTDEFYEIFWIKYLENLPIKDIWNSLGYDPDLIGTKRSEGLVYNLRKQKLTDEQREDSQSRTTDMKRPPAGFDFSSMSNRDAVRAIQTELTYLRQELEFIKKILSADK